MISEELGSNLNEYVHVVARKKMIPSLQSLTEQNKGKLQELRQDILVNSIELIKELNKSVASNIDIK